MSYGYVTPTNGFTIELWFKRNATAAVFTTLFNQRTQASVTWTVGGQNGYGRQLFFGLNGSGAFNLRIVNEGATSGTEVLNYLDPSPSGYSNDNTWHHVAVRLGTNKIAWTLFLDGAVYASGNTSAAINWNPGVFTFGAEYAPHMSDFGTSVWDKWLAYCALFDVALTDNRIFEHYTAGAGGTVYYGDDEVERLNRIADWTDIPIQSREFDSALVNLQGIQVQDANALTAMQDTAGSAFGFLFADGQTRIVYHNRRHSYNKWNAITLAESTDSAPEIGITFTLDTNNIYNDVRGERPFGSTIRMTDDISKAFYGRRVNSFSISVTTSLELQNAVSWILTKYREPVIRVSAISFRAESSDLIEWAGTGGIAIGDHITLAELPPEAAPEVSMEFIVEKIHVDADIKNREYIINFELSPYEVNQVFQVGISSLGETYKIGY